MITVPTTLVLGAGVSMSYGYPSGSGLIDKITAGLKTDPWKALLVRYGTDPKQIDDLRTQLPASHYPSIDAFLEYQPELQEVGQLAIALALFDCEDAGAFTAAKAKDEGIYDCLLQALRTSPERYSENRLQIVTFNYDRSLEHFLYTALEKSYRLDSDRTRELVQQIPIVHVHGQLDPLPWQGEQGRAYGPVLPRERHWYNDAKLLLRARRSAEAASKQVVIVSNAKPNAQQFAEARKHLGEAERVYFLGFGYHPDNLTRLGLAEEPLVHVVDSSLPNYLGPKWTQRRWRGSAMHLGKAEREDLQQRWKIALPDGELNALGFLKEYGGF